MVINGRTDLASEAHELWQGSTERKTELKGVIAREEEICSMKVTEIRITDDHGAKALGKDIGEYFTLELETHFDRGSDSFENTAEAISELILRCAEFSDFSSVLIAALGNPDITPDALGSFTASSTLVTRHLKESSPEQFRGFCSTSLCRTGVLGTTGIESAQQIRLLCKELKPDFVIAVDALAGADVSRLCRTIQICSTGIAPGSGIGNNRARLDKDFLGVPVVGIGMPTVIDAVSLGGSDELGGMFVTPRDIDSSVRNAGKLIAYGINLAVHKGLSVSDIDMLVG